jgi:hypothetical protein
MRLASFSPVSAFKGAKKMTDTPETFTGPYSYLEMSFEEQNQALKLNSPLSPDYRPAACYLIGTRGTVKLWHKPDGHDIEEFSC